MASVHLRPVLAIMSIRLFSEWMKWYTFYPDSASWVPPNQMQQGHKAHCRRVTDMSCIIHVYKEYFEKIHQQMQLLCGIDSKYSLVAVYSHWVIECLNSAPTCEVTAVCLEMRSRTQPCANPCVYEKTILWKILRFGVVSMKKGRKIHNQSSSP